jgi:hypothetical protein
MRLPDGQTLGLYEPSHPLAIRPNSTKIPDGKKRQAKSATIRPAGTKTS